MERCSDSQSKRPSIVFRQSVPYPSIVCTKLTVVTSLDPAETSSPPNRNPTPEPPGTRLDASLVVM